MPTLLDPNTGKPVDVDNPDEAAHAFLNAGYQLPHADEMVPMADPDGKIGSVKAADAYQMLQAGGRFVSSDEHKAAYLDEKYGSLGQTARAGAEGFVRGLTLGGSDLVAGAVSPKTVREMHERQLAHPYIAGAGQIVGGLAPIVASGGAAAPEEGAILGAEGAEAVAGAARGAETLEGASTTARGIEAAAPGTVDTAVARQAPEAMTPAQADVLAPPYSGPFTRAARAAAPVAEAAAPTAADAQAFQAGKQAVDSPAIVQAATEAAANKNPAAAAYQTVAQYAPPSLVAKAGEFAGETVDSLLGKIIGPATDSTLNRVASRVVKTVATGAVEGGLYAAADKLNEEVLGDPELNAEKIIAAFGHGALFGGLIGGGTSAFGAVGTSLLSRTAPKLQSLTDELSLRSLEAGGGRRAALIRQAEERFEGGAKGAARFVNEKGLIVAGDDIAQRATRIKTAANEEGEMLGGIIQGAEDMGAEGVSVNKFAVELKNTRAVQKMALTADLNPSLLGVHPEEQGLTGGQANFLHAITRTGRHIPEIEAAEAADLSSRGLVAETLLPTKQARVALASEVNDAEHGLLKEVSRDGYNKVLKKFPATEESLIRLKERKLISTQGRLTSAGEFAIGPNGRINARTREILNRLVEGNVAGTEEEMALLRHNGLIKTGYKITESGRIVSGLTKRGLIDRINDTLARAAGPDGNVPLSKARQIRQEFDRLSKWNKFEPRPLGELDLYRAARGVMEDHIEQSLKSVDRAVPGVFNKYKASKDAYGKLMWAAEMASKSASAKLSNTRLGLVAKLAATTELLSGHPLGAAAAIAAKFGSEYAPGTAAAMLQKLGRLGTIEKAARKVDEDINASASGWFKRMTGETKKRNAGKTVTRGVTRSLRDEKTEAHTEPAESAHATIQRLHSLNAAGPIDAAKASEVLGGIGEHAPKTTGAIASKLNASVQYLASIAPKDHADYSDITKPRTGRLPSVDYQQFAGQAKAVEEPLQVFRDFAAGRASRADFETVKKNSPKILEQFQAATLRELSKDPARTARIPYQGQMQLAMVLGVPTHWSQQPSGMRFLQADQSTVAKSPNGPQGNKLGAKTSFKHDLGDQLATNVEKISLQSTPGRKGRH